MPRFASLPLRFGLFGGSFDPIHEGHLALAQHAYEALSLTAVLFIPVGKPPHRQALTAPHDVRLSWIRLALNEREKNQGIWAEVCSADAPLPDGSPNFTINLLRTLRERFPTASLTWLIGADAFSHFDSWREWQDISSFAHLAVCSRGEPQPMPSPEWSSTLQQWWANHSHDPAAIAYARAGALISLPFPSLPVASRKIRALLRQHELPNRQMAMRFGLSPAVYEAICQYNPYSPRKPDGNQDLP